MSAYDSSSNMVVRISEYIYNAIYVYTEKTILLRGLKFCWNYQNNFVETSKIMSNDAKNFDTLATSLNVLHNYFDSSTKLLFCIELKFLSAKSFFPCR